MTISVALCTYNGENWLAAQLDSLMAQQLQPTEIVVCDDGSTDGTWHILQQYALQYPALFKMHSNTHNLGPRKNFEQALGLCTGDYLLLCDQDDIWLPEKIAHSVAALLEQPAMAGVFCNGWLINEAGQMLHETMWDALYWEAPLQASTTTPNLLQYLLMNGNIVTGTALCIRRSALQQILPVTEEHEIWHDHWMALVLAAGQQLFWLSEPLLYYRIHEKQQVGFMGRGMSNPGFREAVHQCWLHPENVGAGYTAHLAWSMQAFDRYRPLIAQAYPQALPHINYTGKQLYKRFSLARKNWLRTIPWPARKWRLIKHWLKGGEYLRIRWKEVVSI